MSTAAEDAARSGKVRAFLRLVVIEHSVFALPFAYLAALTAMLTIPIARQHPDQLSGVLGVRFGCGHGEIGANVCFGINDVVQLPSVRWLDLFLITVAMVAARTFAMAANRVIDRELDARNPRTAQRELVTGAVSVRTAVVGSAVSIAGFLAAAAALGPLCLALSPLALVPLVIYPYGKRFTWFCHGILGIAQAVAPVGAWIAVTGHWSWTAVVLGLAVGTWIGGFDLIYACQDVESDRANGVHSVPARFGVRNALRASTATHVVTLALFVWFGALAGLGGWWLAGVALTAGAFAYEHAIVKPDDLSRVNRAFFTVNGYVAIALAAFGVADLVALGLRP